MGGNDARLLPGLAIVQLPLFGDDEGGHHAPRMRRQEIDDDILEHGGARWLHLMLVEEALVGLLRGLGQEIGGDDVEDVLEQMVQPQLLGGAQGMFARAIGEDELAPRQGRDGSGERMVGLQAGAVDVVHELQKLGGADVIFQHQTVQGRAVALIVIFLQGPRRHGVEAEKLRQEQGDSRVDLRPEVAVGRVERVVEIEDPGVHMGETGDDFSIRRRLHRRGRTGASCKRTIGDQRPIFRSVDFQWGSCGSGRR